MESNQPPAVKAVRASYGHTDCARPRHKPILQFGFFCTLLAGSLLPHSGDVPSPIHPTHARPSAPQSALFSRYHPESSFIQLVRSRLSARRLFFRVCRPGSLLSGSPPLVHINDGLARAPYPYKASAVPGHSHFYTAYGVRLPPAYRCFG